MVDLPIETCFWCNDATGRAGASDDSIYIGNQEIGPWCSRCWNEVYDFVRDEVLEPPDPNAACLPSDGTYLVTCKRWEHSYVGHVKGDKTTLFTEHGKWINYDTETLVNDGGRFLQDGKDYRDD